MLIFSSSQFNSTYSLRIPPQQEIRTSRIRSISPISIHMSECTIASFYKTFLVLSISHQYPHLSRIWMNNLL